MSGTDSWQAVDHYLKSQLAGIGAARARGRKPAQPTFVTLSRQAGTGAFDLAARIASLLDLAERKKSDCHWTVFDRDLVGRVIKESPFPADIVEAIESERAPEVAQSMLEFFGLRRSSHGLVAKTSRTMLHLASLGRAIFVGHAASIITGKLPGGFHVRLIASTERRVKHVMTYDHLSEKAALAKLSKEDRARREYTTKYFDRDVADSQLYTLTINADYFSPEEAAHLVVAGILRRRDRR